MKISQKPAGYIAERHFSINTKDTHTLARIYIDSPRKDSNHANDPWKCRVGVETFEKTWTTDCYGVDSLQAIKIALDICQIQTDLLKIQYGDTISFEGQDNLWLGLSYIENLQIKNDNRTA